MLTVILFLDRDQEKKRWISCDLWFIQFKNLEIVVKFRLRISKTSIPPEIMNTPRCRYVVFIVAFEHILDLFHICHILLTLDMYLFAGYLTAFNLFRRENFESFLSHLFYRCLFIRNSVFSLVINKYFPHSYLFKS